MAISVEAHAVHKRLLELGLETPVVEQKLTPAAQIEKIEGLMHQVMGALALDLTDDSMAETPHRIAKMYVNEIFSGLDYNKFPKITLIENKMSATEMIRIRDIELTSTCEHHFVTIDGFADVAYIPGQRIIGLSKINRIVRFFAQRPQVQERLNQQVLVALQTLLDTEDVAVKINATHYCVKARGVMDSHSSTETLSLGGQFLTDRDLRRDFVR
ncbi:MAG: GTP cyclohydrolase I FolE [Reinekea forsetii]|jgi:GTP cyclohydrolase I|uniref:GTP cyclohydrolase I FolE n=1 Tax=Reinekea TaxID=230494 RepID=UPI0023541B28|nr:MULTISPECIES: GTP cyclohydrolase I FolE [Reinekea]MDO7641188.1 GTP cyclohydrolase I FolE [Reinekea forsetii]MDO7644207.1 GTP cyclohydrolase I FolE [Reinekea forsetii]MDO7673489.1 GTP cyclohydrolase I FolE [Reinekea forsetii]